MSDWEAKFVAGIKPRKIVVVVFHGVEIECVQWPWFRCPEIGDPVLGSREMDKPP